MKKISLIILSLLMVLVLSSCKENDNIINEYFVEEYNGVTLSGNEEMKEFYEKTKNGEISKVTFKMTYLNNGKKDEYTHYIYYDGNNYITDFKMYESSPKKSKFKYLIYSESTGDENNLYFKTESYCLANNEKYTYEIVMQSFFSAIMENHINDAIPFYSYHYYKDLCFSNDKIINIVYEKQEFSETLKNRNFLRNLIDKLSWSKEKREYTWSEFDLRVSMTRQILNDSNNLLISTKGETINVEYVFDFDKKIAIMYYPNISSSYGQLYASLGEEDIESIKIFFKENN